MHFCVKELLKIQLIHCFYFESEKNSSLPNYKHENGKRSGENLFPFYSSYIFCYLSNVNICFIVQYM